MKHINNHCPFRHKGYDFTITKIETILNIIKSRPYHKTANAIKNKRQANIQHFIYSALMPTNK